MKKVLLTTIIGIAFLTPFFASAQVPFGGIVAGTPITCDEGLFLTLKTSYGTLPVMWLWGELPFLNYVEPHPGQWLLGELAPGGICTIDGFGFPVGPVIEFHGESL